MVPFPDGAAIAAQAGVDFKVHACRALLVAGGGDHGLQLPPGNSDVDARGDSCLEVALGGVQPGKQWRFDSRGAQRERLGDVRDTEPRRSGVEGGARDLHGSVTVSVGLHNRHHSCGGGNTGELADIVPHGFESIERGTFKHRPISRWGWWTRYRYLQLLRKSP